MSLGRHIKAVALPLTANQNLRELLTICISYDDNLKPNINIWQLISPIFFGS